MRIQLSDHFTYKRLLRFTIPSIIMMICTSVYSIVDGLFVSNYVGTTPFAALNLMMPLLMGISTVGFMIGTGGSAVVAIKLGEGEREKAIVAVGRVDENKNHELLIRAFAGIAEEFPEYRLIIYGDGDKRGALLKLPDQLGLKERISLPGNGSGIAELIYKARVFVQPSNTEGMPNTLIEAMLLGLTVIATDCPCGGPAELIEDGVNGLLTPVGDVEKLKECLRRVLKDQRMADEMGIRAAGLQKDYRTDIVYESWRNFLERVMKRGI